MDTTLESAVSLVNYFSIIPDPRINRRKKYLLVEILLSSVCAVLCGAESFVEIAMYAEQMEQWLKDKIGLSLENGIPSHDTYRRIFELVDPDVFRRAFIDWAESVRVIATGENISIDGKALRATRKGTKEHSAIYIVSAWASESGISLGQMKCHEKSNEITVLPPLLDLLNIKGSTVTIDAVGCQTKVVDKIREKGGDYVLSVKANQKTLAKNVKNIFTQLDLQSPSEKRASNYTSTEKNHGRFEERIYEALSDEDARELGLLNTMAPWKDLNSITRVVSNRSVGSRKAKTTTRYYMSSLTSDAETIAKVIRSHWNVENKLHWSLDVTFREDQSTIRTGHAAENFSLIRRLVLNLLKLDKSKHSIRGKRKLCGWDPEFAFQALANGASVSF